MGRSKELEFILGIWLFSSEEEYDQTFIHTASGLVHQVIAALHSLSTWHFDTLSVLLSFSCLLYLEGHFPPRKFIPALEYV